MKDPFLPNLDAAILIMPPPGSAASLPAWRWPSIPLTESKSKSMSMNPPSAFLLLPFSSSLSTSMRISHTPAFALVLTFAITCAPAPNCNAQGIPSQRPRARPPSELTGWAEWERAAEIFSKITIPPAPPLSPEAAIDTFKVADGFRLELVAAEPLVVHPIFFEFDPDGRIWAVEYRGYMRDLQGNGEGDPICRIVVLEDTNHDGRADKSTVFLDQLVMPRSLAFVKGGVLVAEPPTLWLCRDTNNDLKCDSKVAVGEYGRPGNPQHTANGLAYGLDNWLHSADWARKHQFRNNTLVEEPAIYRGQFGVSFDETGRYVTCRESSPAEMDLIPEEYLRRNPALLASLQRSRDRSRFGIATPIGRPANECFPIRPTPAITLGALELRTNGTLRTYTIVAGTGVYLGDQFPSDAYGNIFVPEAGGHLIGRLKLSPGIEPRAERFYPPGMEILASTDERFRPMNIRTGPDGTLYFADMYKGIIEHVIFMAPYIADQIKARNLAAGNDMGRIYRLVSTAKPVDRTSPALSTASSDSLIQNLHHPNGWRRITAQRLLVEQQDPASVPALRTLASPENRSPAHTNPIARLHALWTLQGLDSLDWKTASDATQDSHPIVRAAAIRLCERLLSRPNQTSSTSDQTVQFLQRLQQSARDSSETVRLQTALSLGAIPAPEADRALAQILETNPGPLFRTAVLSALASRELRFLNLILNLPSWRTPSDSRQLFLKEFSELIFDSRNPTLISALLDTAHSQVGPASWRRSPLLNGLVAAAPPDLSAFKPIPLAHQPQIIPVLLKENDSSQREIGFRMAEMFSWPESHSASLARNPSTQLTPELQKILSEGRDLYQKLCAPCHQPHGGGLPNVAPPLNGSEWVAGPPERLARIILNGLFGPLKAAGTDWNHSMPGFGEALTNSHHAAAVLTYIRQAWDNSSSPIDPTLIDHVRSSTAGRELPWTADELRGLSPTGSASPNNSPLIHPTPNGELHLTGRLATCYGERLAYRPALDILAPWKKENDLALWHVQVPSESTYTVHVTLAADDASTGDTFYIESESSRVHGIVPSTGGYDKFQEIRVGQLKLRSGPNRIVMRPAGKLRAELADIKGLRLVPLP